MTTTARENRGWFGSFNLPTLAGLLFSVIFLMGCGKGLPKDILSPEERRCLLENQGRIVLGVETNSPPLVFLDPQGQPTGLANDHLLLLESKLGVHFQRRNFTTLEEIFTKVRGGEIQVVNAVMDTPRRSEFILFTKPFLSLPNVIIVRKDHSGSMREEDLRGLRVSLVRSFASTERLTEPGRGLVPDLVPDDLTGLLNVSFGRSDAGVFDLATVSHLIQTKGITNLRVAGETGLAMHLAMGTPKSEAQLNRILEKGLAAITAAERQTIRNRWITANDFNPFADSRFWMAVGVFVLVLLAVVTSILLWNRTLRRQVAMRTLELSKGMAALAESRESLAITLNSIGDAVIATDLSGRITRMNPTAERLTGWSLAEAVGRPLAEIFRIVSALTGEPSEDPVKKVLLHGEVVGLANHTLLLARDGREYQISDSAAPIHDSAGNILGMVLVFSDVTEKYRVEEALARTTELLKNATEIASIGAWELELASMKLTWSLGTYRLHELDPATPVDVATGIDFYAPEARPIIAAAVQSAIETGTPYDLELPLLTAKGRAFWARAQCNPITENGRVTKLLGAFQDITERKQSEARFRAMFEVSPIPFALNNAEGRIPFLNPAFTASFGYTAQDLPDLESWWRQAYPDPGYRAGVLAAWGARLARAERDGSAFEPLEVMVCCRDGAVRSVIATSVELKGVHGSTHLVALYDITDRKRNEEALQESNQRNQLATESAHLAVWDWDLRAGTMVWDDRMFELYGTTRPEIDGTLEAWKAGLHPEDLARVMRECEAAIQGDTPFDSEFRLRHRDGAISWIKANAKVLRDPQGDPVRMVGINRDITELKRAEEERSRLQFQLIQSQKMESLGTLAGGVAHDMNNVLGAILGLASAHLGSQPYGSPMYQALDTICKATERGGKMVKSLLSFARQTPAENNQLDMNAILREQVALLERTTLAKVRLEIDLEANLRPILGDASALTHAFMNLCVNAVDAMPENGTLTLHTRNVDHDWIEVVVEDNGTGMPKEVLEKAMEPFFTTKETGKGTGLGLSMVFSTVKAHRGQMAIESEPGTGTRVVMRFPACALENKEQAANPEIPEAIPSRHESLRVLLVDDDELIQSSVQALLEVLGHTDVVTAERGEEALALLEAGLEVDLVILDMNMPGLGGIGTLPRLLGLRPALPVLLATGRADQTAVTLVAAHPGATLLSKPFGLRELQEHLENIGIGSR